MFTPNFYTKKSEVTADYGKFVLEPLPLSFGNSLGNAIRRTLLSSLEGAAITHVKINDAPHLFSTLKGVKESALDIVLNLKQLKFKAVGEGSLKVSLGLKGAKKVSGRDLKGDATVVNGDVYLGEITDSKGTLEIEAVVSRGLGFVAAEDQEVMTGYIAIDAYFSPIKKVNYKVEEARVGRKSNFDRLILEVWTDGSVSPDDALKQASSVLTDHFAHILSGRDVVAVPEKEEALSEGKKEIDPKLRDIIIDELNLPSRVINALLRENVETVADLIEVGKEKLIKVKGLGKKSFVLIEDELKKMGIEL